MLHKKPLIKASQYMPSLMELTLTHALTLVID